MAAFDRPIPAHRASGGTASVPAWSGRPRLEWRRMPCRSAVPSLPKIFGDLVR